MNKDGIVNNNFIYNADTNSIKESKIYFEASYNPFLIDYINLGAYCMFRTYSYSDQKVNESPVYYINNNNEEITCK